MKNTVTAILFSVAAGLTVFAAHAQPLPAGAPTGSTVQCKDGSFAAPEVKSGACSGHKGIKTWYGKTEAKPGPTAPAPEMKSAPNMSSTAPSASKASKASTPTDPSSMTAAPGGGAGKVWVNSASKVYHCESDRYYGKTKRGEYMTEAHAKVKGMRAAYKKTCGG